MEFSASLARELAQLSDRLTAAVARDAEAASSAAKAAHAAEATRLTSRITALTAEVDALKKRLEELDASGALLRARADELTTANRNLALELADRVAERDSVEAAAAALAAERQRTASLERERTDLATAFERQRTELERERTDLAAALENQRKELTAALERERTELTAQLERERTDASEALRREQTERADAVAKAAALADSHAAALAASRAAVQEATDAGAREKAARADLEREAGALRERVAAVSAALQQAESAVERESAGRAALEEEAADLRRQVGSTRATFREELADRVATIFEEIACGTSVEEVLGAAANGLGDEFSRVAVLAVNGGRFEPRYQRGFDSSSGVEQMAGALDDGSLLAAAVRSSELGVHAGASLDALPFGGSPSLAVTAPVLVRGELFAMIYADNDGRPRASDATPLRLADIIRRHTSLRLDGLTLELKTIGELRAYARMLLDEVEYVYRSDVSARKPDGERLERLTENLRCARQIYQQRRALEAPALPSLLEEVIGTAIATKTSTAFGRELASVAPHAHPEEVAVGQ